MAVPYFLLAGELMNAGGLSKKIVAAAMSLVGHIRGGLGYVVIGTGIVLASLSGSAIADTATLAVMLVPMIRLGRVRLESLVRPDRCIGNHRADHPAFRGLRAVWRDDQRIDPEALHGRGRAGSRDGLALIVTWRWLSKNSSETLPPRKSAREMLLACRGAAWAMGMPFIIIGGLKFGLFTPTESAIVAAVYALLGKHRCIPGSLRTRALRCRAERRENLRRDHVHGRPRSR